MGLNPEKHPPDCKLDEDQGAEDVEIGKCLEAVDVAAGDSRDEYGRGRFFPLPPSSHVVPGNLDRASWYWSYIYYPSEEV